MLTNGTSYSCRVDNEGYVSDVDIGGYRADYDAPADEQYGDDYYTAARKQQRDDELEEGVYGDEDGYQSAEAPDYTE